MTHFGAGDDVEGQLDEVGRRLDEFAELARGSDRDTFIATVRRTIEADAGPELLPVYEQAAPPDQLFAGLERYWRKRGEKASQAPGAGVS